LVRVERLSTVLLGVGVLIVALHVGGRVALANHQFSDVPTSAGYHDFVDFLVDNGLTSGCGIGLFCPGSAVTRAQLAIFLEKLVVGGACSPDMVKSGPTCIDKYEASLWWTQDASLIEKIRLGTVTKADLTLPRAAQLGLQTADLAAFGCPDTGNDAGCKDVYAVSIPGVLPARFVSWFQATAAARNAGKRLPTNAEWQAAALGTPAGQPCNTFNSAFVATGTRTGCISHVGAFDMFGNLFEWVADWVPRSTTCGSWGSFSPNSQCLAGADTTGAPGALLRGGFEAFLGGNTAGVFSVGGSFSPSFGGLATVGFRGTR
jgi:hypothetical protein